MNYCGFNIEPFCSDVCGDHRRPQTLAQIWRNMAICCGFRAVDAWEKYSGFILLDTKGHISKEMLLKMLSAKRWPYCSDFNTLRPRQNGRHFTDDIFKCIFLNESVWILIQISLTFVPKEPMDNIPALIQIMACCLSSPSHYLNQWWLD